MENKLLYSIGEALIMEIDEIDNITYPSDFEENSLMIETKNGKSYQLVLRDIK